MNLLAGLTSWRTNPSALHEASIWALHALGCAAGIALLTYAQLAEFQTRVMVLGPIRLLLWRCRAFWPYLECLERCACPLRPARITEVVFSLVILTPKALPQPKHTLHFGCSSTSNKVFRAPDRPCGVLPRRLDPSLLRMCGSLRQNNS